MVAVRPGDAEAVLKRANSDVIVYLFYGPDAGLVSERAKATAERAVDDPADPFQLVRLEGDAVASDPARLADEAGTLGLFGSHRVIWIKPTTRNIARAVETALVETAISARIVVEAGELSKSAPLRTVCERSPHALAVPCYADTTRDIGAVIDEVLRPAGLSIDPEARTALAASLGANRLGTRGELQKLALYAHGQQTISLADVDAVVSDGSTLAIDAVTDAAFTADIAALNFGLQRLLADGVPPAVTLSSALRHAVALLHHRIDIESGRSAAGVAESWRGLHFRRRAAIEKQLSGWTSVALRTVIGFLQESLLATRQMSELAPDLTSSTLIGIAREARRLMSR